MLRTPDPRSLPAAGVRRARGMLAALVCSLALLGAEAAHGQIATLPPSTVTSPTIGQSQVEQIENYLGLTTPGLFSENAAEIRRARAQVVEPLQNRQVSVAFRQAYTRALSDELDRLLGSEDDGQVLLGLVVAGELATDDSVRRILPLLGDEREPIRLFAITRGERLFEMLQQGAPAVSPDQALALARAIGEGITEEENVRLADARTRALAAAASVPASQMQGLRDAALSRLAAGFGARLRGTPAGELDELTLRALTRAAETMRLSMLGADAPAAAALREMLGFSGDVLAIMDDRIHGAGFEEQELRRLASTVTQEAENIYVLARAALTPGGTQPTAPGFARMLEQGNRRDFRLRFLGLFGPAGELTRAPYNLDAQRAQRGGAR